MTPTTPAARWVVATAALCVAALVGAWLLLLGPMLDAAAATRAQAAQVREQNVALEGRLATLRAEFEGIEDVRTELATLREQLPDDARLSHLSREIDAAARTAGVTLVRLEVSDTLDVATAAAAAAAAGAAAPSAGATTSTTSTTSTTDTGAAGTTGTTGADTGTEPAPAAGTAAAPAAGPAAAAATAPAGVAPTPGMLAIPVTTTVAGSVDGVRQFLAALQAGLSRGLLVASLTVTALEESDGGAGSPAAAAGDVEAVIGAFAYVLPDTAAGAAGGQAAADAAEGPLPQASGGSTFLASPPEPAAAPEEPAPDPAAVAAEAIAAAIEQRLAAGTAAAEAAAAASLAAQVAAQAAATTPAPVPAPAPAGTDG